MNGFNEDFIFIRPIRVKVFQVVRHMFNEPEETNPDTIYCSNIIKHIVSW